MSERQYQTPETDTRKLELSARERLELEKKLQDRFEKEHNKLDAEPTTHEQETVHEALKQAAKKEVKAAQGKSPEKQKPTMLSKAEKTANFNATMDEAREQMSAPSRTFSKVIHNKAVEKTSEAVGDTLARPNALLYGAIFAFALTLGMYIIAKNMGYPLSGFETIAAFIFGWVIGITFDFLKVMITGKR